MIIAGQNTEYNVLVGNKIGTDTSGTSALPNPSGGVIIVALAANNTIGGNVAGAANLISGNFSVGVSIEGAADNVVAGNLIGTDSSGSNALANSMAGVEIFGVASGNTVGGTAAGAANIIAFNGGVGVQVGFSPTDASVRQRDSREQHLRQRRAGDRPGR